MFRKGFPKTVSLKTIRKAILFFFFFFQFQKSYSQDLSIPSIWGSAAYTTGTGDGASLTTYNSVYALHSGLVIASPYVSNGNGGYIDKATVVFNGRNGDITSLGLITTIKTHTSEVVVDLNVPGPDYVFDEDYNLPALSSIDTCIKENKHLPEIVSAAEMKKEGINLSEMNIKLLQKVEEQTLCLIELSKEIKVENFRVGKKINSYDQKKNKLSRFVTSNFIVIIGTV